MWTDTKLHRRLQEVLSSLKIDFINEGQFGHYAIDCYSSSLHLGFEADGYFHTLRDETERDKLLFEKYFLILFHLNEEELEMSSLEELQNKVLNFIKEKGSEENKEKHQLLKYGVVSGSFQSLSEYTKNLWRNPEYRNKVVKGMQGKKHPNVEKKCLYCRDILIVEYKRRKQRFCNSSCSAYYRHECGSLGNEKIIEKIRGSAKKFWEDPDFRAKHHELPRKGFRGFQSN